jgi:hypothetical protein
MNTDDFERWLDSEARKLPRSIDPGRDLWPEIDARIAQPQAPRVVPATSRVWPFLAGIAATVVVALAVTQLPRSAPPARVAQSAAPVAGDPAPVVLVERPATWVPEISRARNRLSDGFTTGLQSLPPETRRVVEENLAQIHESLAQIHQALAADPGNVSLHRMLASTYQQELSLISNIGALTETQTQL